MSELTPYQRQRLETLLKLAGVNFKLPEKKEPVELSRREIKRVQKALEENRPDPVIVVKKQNRKLRVYTMASYDKLCSGLKAFHAKRKEVANV